LDEALRRAQKGDPDAYGTVVAAFHDRGLELMPLVAVERRTPPGVEQGRVFQDTNGRLDAVQARPRFPPHGPESGVQRFHHPNDKAEADGERRFIMLWQYDKTDATWQVYKDENRRRFLVQKRA